MSEKKIELLSPAGDYECFQAAINTGADAVYLGGNQFGARAYAQNFSEDELLKAIDYAHAFGKKVFLTVNTVFKNNEISEIKAYLESLYLAGLDAVIVQDIGVISYLRKVFPKLPIHASTQMAITDTEGVLLLKEMGVQRTVLARELSLEEISHIYKKTGMELECFIHGALCYSYSGKCLFSSMLGDRSGNRGRCAQPCRLPYNGQYLLSAKDICTLEILPQLIDSGIMSFKIEGRMKNPQYVAGVTGIYRKYIDQYLSNPDQEYIIDPRDLKMLLNLYTRSGNSQGYYYNHNGRSMITIDKPGYQTADEAERLAAFELYAGKEPKLFLNAEVNLKKDRPAELILELNEKKIGVQGQVVAKANKQPLSKDAVEKQLKKTGGTYFEITELKIEMDQDVFVPVGQLNELRRNALDILSNKLLLPYKRTKGMIAELPEINSTSFDKVSQDKPVIHCAVSSFNQFNAVLDSPFTDIISVPVGMLDLSTDSSHSKNEQKKFEILANSAHTAGKKIYIRLPHVVRNSYFKRNPQLCSLVKCINLDGILVSNYESLHFLKSCCFQKEIIADLHLYAVNNESVNMLKSLGCSRTTVPVELNKKELLKRSADVKHEELIIYGRLPMMVSAQCLKKTLQKCNKRSEIYNMTDRYETVFPVQSECGECCNIIWNSVPLSLHGEKALIDQLCPANVRLQFTIETDSEIKDILKFYYGMFSMKQLNDIRIPFKEFTRGHLNRGVD